MKDWAATCMANDPPPLDDQEIVEACLRGDAVAWEALLTRYKRLIYSIPIKMGLSPNDAADIFQTVCVKLLRGLPTLRNQEKISSWLTITTRRECWHLAAVRRREHVVIPFDDGFSGDEIRESSLEPPDEQLRRLEQQQILRDAVAALPDRCRQLLSMLFYEDELNYNEIARRLQMPRSSIGPTRARCLVRLRKVLKGKI